MAHKPVIETHHHIVPIRTYAGVLLVLFCLMALTVFVGYNQVPSDVGPISATLVNQGIALVIAFAKATLVVLFFMGAKWSTSLTRIWTLCGFVFVTLFTITFADYGTRQTEQVQGWEPRESAMPREIQEQQVLPPPNELNIRPRPQTSVIP